MSDRPSATMSGVFEHIVEHLPMGVHIYELRDEDRLVFLGANPAAERILKLDHRRLVGKTLEESFPLLVGTELPARYRAVALSGETWQKDLVEYESAKGSGVFEVVVFRLAPCRVAVFFNDISEWKRGQEAESRLFSLQREMINTAAVWINSLDAAGNVTLWNRVAEEISGYTAAEVLGHGRIWEWLYPDDAYRNEILARAMEIINLGKRVEGLETLIRCRDGSVKVISWYSHQLYDDRGVIAGSLAFGVDLTAQKAAELERERLDEQLAQARKLESIGRLAGGVAHDFNNMLGVILGHCELALLTLSANNPALEHFRHIKDAGERSATLTKQLLAFARKQTIKPQVLDLNRAVSGMSKMLARLIGAGIELVWKPTADLWPVLIDPGQLDQILTNLCVNARDAMNGQGTMVIATSKVGAAEAVVETQGELAFGEYVQLSVADTGCGMDEEALGRLFEPFFTTKEPGRGTGLGLAMIHGIVKQNCGAIRVKSAPGKGSTFSIFLPRHQGESGGVEKHPAAKDIPGGGETILLVEDEPSFLGLVSQMLRSLGYRVFEAANGAEALALAEAGESFQLLVTDVVMPGLNGRELAVRLREHRQDLKVIYITGHAADILGHGDDAALLQKPFAVPELARMVRQTLDQG